MGTTKIIKSTRGYTLEGDPVDLNVHRVDGKHASEIVQTKIGSFACPTTTGNYSVTGIGFKPKLVEFWVTKNEVDNLRLGIGRMDYSGLQHAIAIFGHLTYSHRSNSRTDACLWIQASNGAIHLLANYKSMDDDGFTINVTELYQVETTQILWKAIG